MNIFHQHLKFAKQELNWIPGDSEEQYKYNLTHRYDQLKQHGWIDKKITYKFNSHGFRCEEFDSIDSVVTLGCSWTFGFGLPNEATWPYIVGKNLNLTCYNLGISGASHDTSFRLAYYWLEKIKPKLVIFWNTGLQRFEILTGTKSYNYMPSAEKLLHNPAGVGGVEWYKHWVTTDDNSELNKAKNVLAVHQLCNQLGIKFIWSENVPDIGPDSKAQTTSLARDLLHPGVETNLNFATAVTNYI
jgi:hypothetical protein